MDFVGYEHFQGGFHLGYTRTHLITDDNFAKSDTDSYFASAYGTWMNQAGYLEGTLTLGWHQYQDERNIDIGTIHRTATSKHKGQAVSTGLGTGTVLPWGRWQVQPRAALLYTFLNQPSFIETGADSLNMHVATRETHSLKSELGAQLARVFHLGEENLLIPEISAAWEHDFDVDDRQITTSFEGLPGNTFTVQQTDVPTESGRLHAGLILVHKKRFQTSLSYDALLHKNYTAHGVSGEVRISF